MFKYIFIFYILVSSISCSQISRNNVTESELIVEDGHYKGKPFKERMNFNRRSWYFDFTLVFDVLWVDLKKQENFSKWLSTEESKYIQECDKLYLTLMYEKSPGPLKKSKFKELVDKTGAKFVELAGFKEHFKSHGEYVDHLFQSYELKGLCYYKDSKEKLDISFANFPSTIVF